LYFLDDDGREYKAEIVKRVLKTPEQTRSPRTPGTPLKIATPA